MNESLAMLLILAGSYLFVLLLVLGTLWFTPQMTRPSIFFGVTVDPSLRKTPFAAECISRFHRGILLHSLLALVITAVPAGALWFLLGNPAPGIVAGAVAGVFWQMFGAMLAFVSVHKMVQPHAARPTSVREASLVPRAATAGNARLFAAMILAPLLILASCSLYLWTRWADIPPRFVSHWGLHGADAWTNKSVAGVFWPFLLALGTYLPLLLVAVFLTRARRVHASGPGAVQEDRFAHYTLLILMLMGCFLVAVIAGIAVYLPLRESQETPTAMITVILAGNLLVDIGAMLALIRMGQGGSRLPVEPAETPPAGPAVIGDRTDDRYWKWGLFYNNPNDPALWVEKRFGIGWTINMAHPKAWLTIIALTAPGLVLPLAIILAVNLASPKAPPRAALAQRVVQGRTIPFENDPQLVGTWKSVDFVRQIQDFNPATRRFRGDLYLKELVVQPSGTIADMTFQWTRGLIFQDDAGPPGHYEIRQIDGQTYLFFEWISGDVTIRGQKPQYYVLRKATM